MIELSTNEAWNNVDEKNAQSRWTSVAVRAHDAAVLAVTKDHVGLTRDDDIFCVGSCFAKNIERKLVADGFRVLSHPKFAPPPPQPFAALPNIFSVHSICNEIRWGLTDWQPAPEDCFVSDDRGFLYDPHSNHTMFRGAPEEVRANRAGVTANMRRLRDCRIVILTLGLVEVWFDRKLNVYLNATLPRFLLEREPDRYALRILDYTDCLNGLEEAWNLIARHGRPDTEIFLSVSPVPLAGTFSLNDVLVANAYSKSTQLAAARDFSDRHANVHYVPSFESVMNSSRKFAWKADLRHVTDEMVDRVIDVFLASQIAGATAKPAAAPTASDGDWPLDATSTKDRHGLPNFFSAKPGDRDFPAGFPQVTASSSLKPQFDASCLMSETKRTWHAQTPPAYPEWLLFRFDKPLAVRRFFVQSQIGHPDRSPTVMALEAHIDNGWQTVLSVPRVQWQRGGEWQGWQLEREATSTIFRLRILANNGSANLLTVQNVYLAP